MLNQDVRASTFQSYHKNLRQPTFACASSLCWFPLQPKCHYLSFFIRGPEFLIYITQGPQNGGLSNGGGFPIWTCPSFFLSFFVLFWDSRFFWDFPDLSGDSSGIFLICPFPLSRPINSAYEEQSRKGPRHNLDLSRKKVGNPPVWKLPNYRYLYHLLL